MNLVKFTCENKSYAQKLCENKSYKVIWGKKKNKTRRN